MRAVDGQAYSNIAATQAAINLVGGKYGMTVTATFAAGSVAIEKLHIDGTTWQVVLNATAAGYSTVDIPPGTYRIAVTTATAVYVGVQRIPGE